jgi:hypothetical protein
MTTAWSSSSSTPFSAVSWRYAWRALCGTYVRARAVFSRTARSGRLCPCVYATQIHWLSILNSVILVVLLTSFLFIILMRVLRNDYARYSAVEADPEDGALLLPPLPSLRLRTGTGTDAHTRTVGWGAGQMRRTMAGS